MFVCIYLRANIFFIACFDLNNVLIMNLYHTYKYIMLNDGWKTECYFVNNERNLKEEPLKSDYVYFKISKIYG